jgi:spore coat protein A
MRPSRRQILKLGALGAATLALPSLGYALTRGGPRPSPTVSPFEAPLPIPPVLRPARTDATTDYYEMTQRQASATLIPGHVTTIWGYDGIFPGPTIKARRGRQVVVLQTNALSVPTVTHLHGGVTSPEHDGFPTDVVEPGGSREYVFSNQRRAATLWYHDHALHDSGRNVYMGLVGLYIVEDEDESRLPLPRGAYDIPLILGERRLDEHGAIRYDAGFHFGTGGDLALVNGAAWPALEVARRKYRFRIVNASNVHVYALALDPGGEVVQIATDGGLLPSPVPTTSILLGPGERVEVVVDFAAYPLGAEVTLQDGRGEGSLGQIMQFKVVRATLGVVERLAESDAVQTRDFYFGGTPGLKNPPIVQTINGMAFDPVRVDAAPHYGDVEIWRFRANERNHPVHLHLVDFQILDRNGEPPAPYERGWKDTVTLLPNDEVRVIARFEGYRGRYLLHCHNLEHEDHVMMARFDVV